MEKNKIQQGKECEIIADLLPIYLDRETQEDTNHYIEEHLVSCQSCRQNYQWMKSSFEEVLHEGNAERKKKPKNKMFQKVKWKMFLYGYVFLLVAIWLYCVFDLAFGF